MREVPIESADPLWRQAISGAQILFVAFGALVLVPLLTGLNPSMALLGAGVGTLLFQLVTGRQVPIFLGSSFAFIAPIIYSMQTWGLSATMGALACVSLVYFLFSALVWRHGAEIVHRFMPPVVIGPIIMIIGLSLAAVAVNMAMGRSHTCPALSRLQIRYARAKARRSTLRPVFYYADAPSIRQ